MEPDLDTSVTPFNIDTIPMWLKPDLWDENKEVSFRGLLSVVLYTLSFSAYCALLAVPVGLYMFIGSTHAANATFWIWLILSLVFGPLIGLLAWWDFVRKRRNSLDKSGDKGGDQEHKPGQGQEGLQGGEGRPLDGRTPHPPDSGHALEDWPVPPSR